MFIDYTIRKEDELSARYTLFTFIDILICVWIIDVMLSIIYLVGVTQNKDIFFSTPSYIFLGLFSLSYFIIGKLLLSDQRFKKTKYSLFFLLPVLNIFFFKLEFVSVILSGIFKWIWSIGEDYRNSSENELNNQIQRITEHNKRVTKKIEAIKKNIDSDTKIDKDILRDYERTLEILKN